MTWTFIIRGAGNPWPVAGILAASAGAFVLAAGVSRIDRAIVPVAILAVGAVVAFTAGGELFGARPLKGPFAYVNAKGAFFMLVAIAGLMLAVCGSGWALRMAGLVAAIGSASVPIAAHVVASTVLLIAIPVPVALLASFGTRPARAAVALCGSLFAIAVLATAILGAAGPSSRIARESSSFLTATRLTLWHDAEEMLSAQPLSGIGPGRFGSEVPTSRRDRGNRLFWAQNEILQQGAEQGLLGASLLLALFLWGFVALGASREVDVVAVLAAAALAAAGIQACEDYILHFPSVSMTAAALVGVGMAAPRRQGEVIP